MGGQAKGFGLPEGERSLNDAIPAGTSKSYAGISVSQITLVCTSGGTATVTLTSGS